MKSFCRTILAVTALLGAVDLAQGATAGHMLKSTAPAANNDDAIVTGSIPKVSATTPVKKRGSKPSDVTGSIKPKPGAGQ